jgi:hypothetical protein
MKRVPTGNQLASIPSGALVELFQDQSISASDDAGPQFAASTLFGTAQEALDIAEQIAGGTTTDVTATADGLTTGLIPATAQHVEVTSGDATHIVTLPAATNGKRITIRVIATGCELRSAVAGDKVNNVVVGATNEAALVAGTLYDLQYVEATVNWVMTGLTALGAVETPVIPDAV